LSLVADNHIESHGLSRIGLDERETRPPVGVTFDCITQRGANVGFNNFHHAAQLPTGLNLNDPRLFMPSDVDAAPSHN
jgi:hypothetical protein